MLFVVTHVHPPELCPCDNPELVKKTVGVMGSKAHAEKSGVRVLGSYMVPEEHTFFFIIESNDYGKIMDFFKPIAKLGTLRITPVGVLGELVTKFE
jgi:uncharacterized protein with GYD domain